MVCSMVSFCSYFSLPSLFILKLFSLLNYLPDMILSLFIVLGILRLILVLFETVFPFS